ncbi:unnamed protein product [Tuber aestivum]|uniref:Uncharacterized protein n=1 Tax=Tuber aestivum TaxID=59557 RepID=A0A292Q6Q9_9PEZI|nr:unnamed protein product [Tuber aestivum]
MAVENTTSEDGSPLIEDSSRQKNHGRLFWMEMSWRFALGLLFNIFIVLILYTFSQKGNLSRWEKRWFNALTISFSSLVSLMLGSLLGLLGSMLRWQLLARKLHNPMDVDLILGIANPTGAFRLIYHHTKDWKWSATTVVVVIYLFINIVGRLSVAAFGLTYDLNELPGLKYPVKLTDWSTPAWFNVSAGGYDLLSQTSRRMSDYAAVGMSTVLTEFDSTNPTITLTNSSGQGLDRKVEGDKVIYSYSLKEYQGLDVHPARDKVLHSSSSCVGRTMWGSNIFEDGKLVGNVDEVDESSPDFLNVLVGLFTSYYEAEIDYIWINKLDYSQLSSPAACATTCKYSQTNHSYPRLTKSPQDLYSEVWQSYKDKHDRNATFFECMTCLTDTNNNPGIGDDILFHQPSENSPLVAGHLLRFGTFERVFGGYDSKGSQLAIRLYSSMNKNSHFLNNMGNELHTGATGDAPHVEVPVEAELYAAHLAARLPLLAIIGADSQLPKVTREKGASEQPFISVALEVKWTRTIVVLVSILIGQLLAVAVVKFMCRNVFLRDHDSFLSLARILKTSMQKVEGRSAGNGKDLATFLDGEGVRMRYGTRAREDYLEVDLWDDVQNWFPDSLYA